ncbi:MAG: alpha/beta fold hydrolase [Acidimicrobiia bacterium]
MARRVEPVTFRGSQGTDLAARLDLPATPASAYALFAHCFTCTKDEVAESRIAAELTNLGIGVLRFDFTGLGASGGNFADTNLSSNTADLLLATDWLRRHRQAPQLLIGHSLGGAAVLQIAGSVPEARAVVSISAPSDQEPITRLFAGKLDEIEVEGEALVQLAGRAFSIQRQFVDDLRTHRVLDHVATMRKALLILHSPHDEIVGIQHAERLFAAARHPKSYVSLDNANHLLTDRSDAVYAARVISAWARPYLDDQSGEAPVPGRRAQVVVAETTQGVFLNRVVTGDHHLLADEPEAAGGLDAGPSPYDLLAASLGACMSMTVRLFAERRRIRLERVIVEVDHARVHARDSETCIEGYTPMVDRFECRLQLEGDIAESDRERLVAVANHCPVHRVVEASSKIVITEIPPAFSSPPSPELLTGRRMS